MLCAFASCVGFLSLCLSLGYFAGSKAVVEDLPMRNLDSSVASIFVEEKIETDSRIALVQQARPDIHAAAAFMGSDFVVDYDLSYFFPKAYGFSLGGEPHDAVSLSPIYDISPDYGFDSLLVKGSGYRSEELDVCLINELLYQKLGADCVGKSLSMEFKNDISSLGLADEVKISARMEIVGVVREFSFLNEPKIYYSYLSAKNVLARYELDNLTREFATEMTALDVIEMASGNSTVSGFALNVFAKRFDRSKELINRIKQNDGDVYSFSSRSYSAVSSFESLTSAFETCLFLFVGVSGAMLIIRCLCQTKERCINPLLPWWAAERLNDDFLIGVHSPFHRRMPRRPDPFATCRDWNRFLDEILFRCVGNCKNPVFEFPRGSVPFANWLHPDSCACVASIYGACSCGCRQVFDSGGTTR